MRIRTLAATLLATTTALFVFDQPAQSEAEFVINYRISFKTYPAKNLSARAHEDD